MKNEDPEIRARRLHAEAQRRYKSKLAKRGIPTYEIAMKALGEAFGSIANAPAQIVNTDTRALLRAVLVETLDSLKAAGYDREQSRLMLMRHLHDLGLDYALRQTAKAAAGTDDGPASGSYSPDA